METRACAGTITYHIPSRKILMIKVKHRKSGSIYYTLPKGEIEDNESPIDAALRETIEETGASINIIKKVDTIEVYRMYNNVRFHKKITFYLAITNSLNLGHHDRETLGGIFVPFDICLIKLKERDVDYIKPVLKSLYMLYRYKPDLFSI